MQDAKIKLAPSILAADFSRLSEQVQQAETAGADRIHVDIMDGLLVPNLSMGSPAALERVSLVQRIQEPSEGAHFAIGRLAIYPSFVPQLGRERSAD